MPEVFYHYFCLEWCQLDPVLVLLYLKECFLSFACLLQAASYRRVPSSSSGGVTSARTRGWASPTMTWFTWSLQPRWSGPAEQPRLAECSTARVRVRAKPTALPPWGSHLRDPQPPLSHLSPSHNNYHLCLHLKLALANLLANLLPLMPNLHTGAPVLWMGELHKWKKYPLLLPYPA